MTTDDAVRALLSWLATYALHSTLFLGGAWALCALRPPRRNRDRERLWKLALVGGLASASLQLASGARPLLGHIDWRPVGSREAVSAMQTPSLALPESEREPGERTLATGAPAAVETRSSSPSPVLATGQGARPSPRVQREPVAAPRAPRLPRAPTAASPRPPARDQGEGEHVSTPAAAAPPPMSALESPGLPARLNEPAWSERWPGLVLGLWIATGLAGLVGLLVSWTGLRRRLLGRRLLSDGPLVELLGRLRAQAGVRQGVRLSVSPRITVPFSTGLLRPEICLPAAVPATLSRAQQEALLAHELAHVVRRDPAWFGLGFAIEKLFFFQPLNRLARRQLSELAEVACDDWAVRWTGARLALASCLTEVAGWVVGERPRLVAPPGLAGQRSRLGQRVARLLDERRSPAGEPPARWWPPLAAGALATAALAVPGVSASEREIRALPKNAAPAPASALASPAPRSGVPVFEPPAALELSGGRSVLESELAMLESEIAALHAELEARALRTRFAAALERIDARVAELRVQQARARALLERLATPNTPVSAPAPLAEALPPTTDPGNPR